MTVSEETQKKPDPTAEAISAMLKENTGSHMLDSGGAYGRHHERNRTRIFESEPESTFKVHGWRANNGKRYTELDCTINLYHFLKNRLCLDERLDAIWKHWANKPARVDEHWHQLVQQFPVWLKKQCPKMEMKTFGDRVNRPVMIYTYNEENFINQDFYFSYWESDYEEYYLVGSHNGCDARGGFSTPRLFTGNGNSEHALFDYGRFSIMCTGRPTNQLLIPGHEEADRHVWDSEGGCRFHNETYPKEGPDYLEDAPVVFAEGHELYDPEDDRTGAILVSADESKAYCPVCRAPLEGYPWP